jgi:replicative superfamily II helicase
MLRITSFGRICAAQGVRLETFAALREFLEEQSDEIDELALIFTALFTPDGSIIRLVNPPSREQCSDALMQKVEENAKRLSLQELIDEHGVEKVVREFSHTEMRVTVYGAVKTAHIMDGWTQGWPLRKISKELETSFAEGDVIRCGEILGWLIRTAELIGQAMNLEVDVTDQLGKLSQRLIFGVPEDALTLARFNSIARLRGLNRDIQVHLADSGFKSLNQIIEADTSELPLGYEYALGIQRAILNHIASIPKKGKRFHVQRLRAAQIDRDYGDIIRRCYDTYDHEFEDAMRGLLAAIGLRLRHVSDRKPHRPDALTYVGETEDSLIAWEFKAKKKNLVTQEEANEILSEGAHATQS